MRLIDMVRTGNFTLHPDVQATLNRCGLDIVAEANSATPIEISNVVQWLKSDWYPKGYRQSDLAHQFSDVRPSFPVSWFEYAKGEGVGRRAVCCVVDGDGGWIIMVVDQCPDSPLGKKPMLSHIAFADLSGPVRFAYDANEPDGEQACKFLIGSAAVPALMAQTLMHCKNVSVMQTRPQPKRAKKFNRNHGFPPSEFRTVVIEPMKAAVRSSVCAGTTEAAAKQRMHVIRGHFKTYSAEKKLFGKVSGRFFFSAHVAGDPTIGVIKSSYVVKGAA